MRNPICTTTRSPAELKWENDENSGIFVTDNDESSSIITRHDEKNSRFTQMLKYEVRTCTGLGISRVEFAR